MGILEDLPIHRGPAQGVPVGSPPHHHAVHEPQLLLAGRQILQAAIQLNTELGPFPFESLHHIPAERRHGSVLLGVEPLKPRFAGVHGEAASARRGHAVDEAQ